MTLGKEPVIWFIFFIVAAAGVYLLAFSIQDEISPESSFARYLLEAAPALSAALALPAFFLFLRFCLNSPIFRPRPSRSRHIIAAILISMAAITTVKAFRMYMQDGVFPLPGFIGALVGSVLFWFLWRSTKNWLHQE